MSSFFINGRAINNIEDLEDDEVDEDDDDDEEEEMDEEVYQDDNYLGNQMNNNNLNRIIGTDYLLNGIGSWNNAKNIQSTNKNVSKGNKKSKNNKQDKNVALLKHQIDRKSVNRQVSNKQKKTTKDMDTNNTTGYNSTFDPASFLDLCFNTNHLESM